MTENREWKDISGYSGLYKISDKGEVYSLITNKVLIQKQDTKGYMKVNLYKNRKMKSHRVHRIVAKEFISNPHNKEQVNHLDENKLNNSVENLEWSTPFENVNHGTRNKRASKPVVQMNKNDKSIIKYFDSGQKASQETGIDRGQISRCCSGHLQTAGGYKWMFL